MEGVMTASFKDRLRENEPLFGTLLSLPSPEIAEICAAAGFDWLFVDLEHGLLSFADAQRIVQAAGPACPCLVRVPSVDPGAISKALDIGPAGLIFPHIDGAEDTRNAVRASFYPPQGARSVGIARAQGYGARLAESLDRANREIVLIAQAEHINAARAIESILAVPGLDGIFIGPYDLSGSLGKPGRFDDPEVEKAIAKIRDACAIAHFPSGILAGNAEAARGFAREGYRLICVASETMLLGDAARRILASVKAS
jgi:2-dehydro-3-deoxyglucarate aldolase/4-hydroxy-2-oxoheptanedioate aldolase